MKFGLKDVIYITAIFVVMFLFYRHYTNHTSKMEEFGGLQSLYEASQDTLHQTRNKLGQQQSEIQLLTSSKNDLFWFADKVQAPEIERLRKLIRAGANSATTIADKTTGRVVSTDTNIVIIMRDTIHHGDTIYIYPTYQTSIRGEWATFNASASKDTFAINYKISNSYEITQVFEKHGWFKPQTSVVRVLNLNPNTETVELHSFAVKPPKQRKGLLIVVGLIGGFTLGYVLR